MARTSLPTAIAIVLLLASGLSGTLLAGFAPLAQGAAPAVTGAINGPADVGESLHANYTVTATGGPAEASNGTTIGTYAYNASVTGINATGASINPSTGVLLNGSVVLDLIAPAAAETLTITVLITSSYQKNNQSNNLSYAVQIVEPYRLNATLVAASGVTVGPLKLTVTLDGTPVGSISVPVMTAGSTYPINFAYVDLGLSPGTTPSRSRSPPSTAS